MVQKAKGQLSFSYTSYLIVIALILDSLRRYQTVTRQFYLNTPFNHNNNLILPVSFKLQILEAKIKVTTTSGKRSLKFKHFLTSQAKLTM